MTLTFPESAFGGSSQPPRPDPRQAEAHDCLDALLEISHGLSEWEVGFIEDCNQWAGELTDRQINKILELYDREC